MSTDLSRVADPGSIKLYTTEPDHHDPITLRSIGFWLYMMSDIMIFAGLFAAHGVYGDAYGTSKITAAQVIDPISALFPTLFLFSSVLFFGLAGVALKNNDRKEVLRWMTAAFVVGLVFVLQEIWEFVKLAQEGAVPQASAFLSDFWTIVWAHGLHVIVGLIWMAVVLIQVLRDGFTEAVVGRFLNLRIFWFFQAVVWVFVYTFVYLMGVS
ncbi:MAG: cytochrome c oxidase subunit 3 [Salinisphaera sp.]|jgi:cytochrome o ubiquinol oxidase subunit 3|nr:cytochrome c oxidase subunit 3 [Salinisphaera sp.]